MEVQTTDTANGAGADTATQSALLNGNTAPSDAPVNAGNDQGAQDTKHESNGADKTATGQDGGEQRSSNDPGDWRHEFAEGLDEKDRDAWLNESSRVENKAAMAKRFLDMRRNQSQAITIPAEDDPDRESKMGDVFTKLGRPESPDAYQLNWEGPEPLTESETAAFDEFKQVHFRNGGTQKSLDEMVKWESQQRTVQMEAMKAKAQDTAAECMSTLKATWGGDFDRNKAVYNNTVTHYMGNDTEEFASLQLADGTLVADHPVVARAFTKVGLERANDDFDYTPMNADRKQNAQTKLKALQDEMKEKGMRPGMPGYPTQEFERLYQEVGSTRPRTGQEHRARHTGTTV